MADTIRQQIIDAIKTRFETILKGNGYSTDLGAHVFWWKETPFQATDLPAINCKDQVDEIFDALKTFEGDAYALTVHIELFFGDYMPIEELRKGISDLITVVNLDDTWTNLAVYSEIGNGEIQSKQSENIEAAAAMPLTVFYRTAQGNPFSLP